MSSKSTHMVLILDLTPSRTLESTQEGLAHWLDSAIAFANSHLLLSEKNTLSVIGCHVDSNQFLYTSEGLVKEVTPKDGQHEVFLTVTEEIRDKVTQMVKEAARKLSEKKDAGVTLTPVEPQLSCSIALALCRINATRKDTDSARVVILTPARDHPFFLTSQYMNFMNAFFTAQKMDVIVDVATIATPEEDSRDSILRQACDITGGSYLSIPNHKATLQYLIWVILPDVETRKNLVLPQKIPVGSKAACFCHRNILDIGYVCSVCLSGESDSACQSCLFRQSTWHHFSLSFSFSSILSLPIIIIATTNMPFWHTVFCSFSPICSTCR